MKIYSKRLGKAVKKGAFTKARWILAQQKERLSGRKRIKALVDTHLKQSYAVRKQAYLSSAKASAEECNCACRREFFKGFFGKRSSKGLNEGES